MPRTHTPTPRRSGGRATVAIATLLAATAIAFATSAVASSVPPSGGGDVLGAACPCSGPAIGGNWRSHGQYVSCLNREARRESRASSLSVKEARQIVRTGARSSCGRSGGAEGNVRVCATNPVLPCPTVRTARVDDCSECDAALAGKLVHCARVASRGGETSVCGATAAKLRPGSPQVLEMRTGVDCASCKAKLGKPQPEGLDCVVAACGSPLP